MCTCIRNALVAMLCALAAPAPAQSPPTEAQVKAAMIYNFAKYVDWPADAFAAREAAIVLCTVGRDSLGESLAAIEGRMVGRRALRLQRSVDPDETRGCNIVFVPAAEERRLLQILRAAAADPMLTVSDIGGFAARGGMIGIMEADNRLQFEINNGAAQRAGLRISSQLLRLARQIFDSKAREP